MIRLLYFLQILGYVRARIEMLRGLGLIYEDADDYILGNGAFEFDLEINHEIPILEFGGGCVFEKEELLQMGQKLGIDTEVLKISEKNDFNLNQIVTKALVKKSLELTTEVRDRFLKTLPDKSHDMVNLQKVIKNKGIENCDKMLHCEFTTDLIPKTCEFEKDSCPSDYICCDQYRRNNNLCPNKAYMELMRFVSIEKKMGRNTESAICIHIVSAHKAVTRNKRSVLNYWKSGGILNTLTGGYTDQVIDMEKLERSREDIRLEQKILNNRNLMIKMNVQFNELQMRLNEHVCKMSKSIIENLLHFEANVIFQETKMQIDQGMHTCWQNFLPLSVPIAKLTAICNEIMGENNEACFYPYNLFRCENKGLWINQNMIVHQVKVTFVKPVTGFQAIKIHVVPIPIIGEKNKYLEINTGSKIVFKNDKMGVFSFSKCENRKIFSLCEIGSDNEILNDECMIGILQMNETMISTKCSTQIVTGNSCVYKTIKGNIILSSHENIDIYRQSSENIEFTKDRLLKRQKGLFLIEDNNINFNCGLINYQNVQLPKITIVQSKLHLELKIDELPVKQTEILFNEPKSEPDFNFNVTNISFIIASVALIGVIVILIFKIKNKIKIKIKSWEIQKLRKALLNRQDLESHNNNIQENRRESFESVQLD